LSKRVGILGGSFNPVHHGHLMLARDALEQFDLSEVRFVPCARPAHKRGDSLAATVHRLRMLELALAGEPFTISSIELERTGISYAIDTVKHLAQYEPDVEWCWIIGSDTLKDLHTWYNLSELLQLCRFVTLSRPGFHPEPADLRLPPLWHDRLLADVRVGHLMDISSSDIRERVASGRAIRFLAPDAVCDYIERNKLYLNQEKT